MKRIKTTAALALSFQIGLIFFSAFSLAGGFGALSPAFTALHYTLIIVNVMAAAVNILTIIS